jgi:predicted nucleic acid-binding protein
MLRLVGVHGDAEQIAEVVSDLSRQAPELLLIECAHVLGKMERRRALSAAKATSHIKIIHAMVDIHSTVEDPVDYLAIANRLQHSAYDVRFLVLAQRLAIPLLTLDERLRREGQASEDRRQG